MNMNFKVYRLYSQHAKWDIKPLILFVGLYLFLYLLVWANCHHTKSNIAKQAFVLKISKTRNYSIGKFLFYAIDCLSVKNILLFVN